MLFYAIFYIFLYCVYDLIMNKTAEQRTLHSNTVIGTVAVDGWAVTFGTARRGLGGSALQRVNQRFKCVAGIGFLCD